MSWGKKTVLGSALLALAIVSGPAMAQKHKETPEEKQLYELSLQQEQAAASKWAAEHPAEARAQWDKNAQSIEENDRKFQAFKRQPPQRPQDCEPEAAEDLVELLRRRRWGHRQRWATCR